MTGSSNDNKNGKLDRTLEAVKSCYSTWGESYHRDYYGPDAAYPPLHVDIVKRELSAAGAKVVLDAGCGPASMLRELFDQKLTLHGFDLTPEMLTEAKRVFADQGLDPESLWLGNALQGDDYRRDGLSPEGYDAVLSFGVFPHIPVEADDTLIANMHAAARPGGRVLAEARNGLFSLFTLNRYSRDLFLGELIDVESLRAAAGDESDGLEAGLSQLEGMFRTDLPPVRTGHEDEPGYDEILSRTHNPIELKSRFERAGFSDVRVLFYHFHSLPPMIGSQVPDLFHRSSLAMEADPEDWRGYFMASAFILSAHRP